MIPVRVDSNAIQNRANHKVIRPTPEERLVLGADNQMIDDVQRQNDKRSRNVGHPSDVRVVHRKVPESIPLLSGLHHEFTIIPALEARCWNTTQVVDQVTQENDFIRIRFRGKDGVLAVMSYPQKSIPHGLRNSRFGVLMRRD